jgi:hydrogenase nickel insertion protein HypA
MIVCAERDTLSVKKNHPIASTYHEIEQGGTGFMHEGAVMQGVVKTILASVEQAGASHVHSVELELGVSGHFTEEAVRQYFQLLTQGTSIEGATLILSWLPATYQCLSCLHRFESIASPATCPLCSDVALEISHQDECSIRSIDVASSDE